LSDNNKVQAKGFVQTDMSIEPLADKLAAFNLQPWEVRNGHNVAEIIDLFNTLHTQRRGKPSAIILNTIKGKGIGACQHNPNWHTSAPRNQETAQAWLMELWHRSGRRLGIPNTSPWGDDHNVPPSTTTRTKSSKQAQVER
jgi:transketolase